MRNCWRTCGVLVAGLLTLLPLRATAQAGEVTGTVRSRGDGLPRVRVVAMVNEVLRGETIADERGAYRLQLPPGEYMVVFLLPGYVTQRLSGVRVGPTGTTVLDAELVVSQTELEKIVVSAGRRRERALDVASSVTVIDETALRQRVTTSPLDHVLSAPGVDVAVQGLQGRQVVARGFSGTFNPALLMMSDYRNTALPSVRASLSYFLSPNADDLDRVEVVRGPASALYGSNAADGVVHFITKSPFDSPGTTLSVTGGGRSLFEGTGRYAAVVNDRFAFKVSGTYFRGREWPVPTQPSETVARDPIAERRNAELRADLRVSKTAAAVLSLGTTTAMRNVEYTPIGSYQLDNSRSDFAQLRFTDGSLFAQAYVNRANGPVGSTVNLQTGFSSVDHSTVGAAQLMHGRTFGTHTDVTYGLDVQRIEPKTSGTVNGRNEDDDTSLETGLYAQVVTRVRPRLQLIGAARVDRNDRVGGTVLSPRVALVFTPATGQRFRLGYNRAFSSPTPGNLFLDVVAARLDPLPFTIRAAGVPREGFRFSRDCGGLCMSSPFAPGQRLPLDATTLWGAVVQIMRGAGVDLSGLPAPSKSDVSTVLRALDLRTGTFATTSGVVQDVPALLPTITNSFEAGYKGLVGQRLMFDGAVYATQRRNFIAPLTLVTPNVFLSTASLAAYLGRFMPAAQAGQLAAGIGGVDGNAQAPGIPLGTVSPSGSLAGGDILLTYRNVGDVRLWGTDLAATYSATDRLTLSGSWSWVSDNFFGASGSSGIDLSTNTPRSKLLLAARFQEPVRDASFEVRARHVGGFRMVDGVWNGRVDAFTTADVEVGVAIPRVQGARLTLTAHNVTNDRHSEFFSAPVLGRLLLSRVQLRF